MTKTGNYRPGGDLELSAWFSTFVRVLESLASLLGIAPDEVAKVKKNAEYFRFVCETKYALARTLAEWTVVKNDVRRGKAVGAQPAPLVLPAAPPAAESDVFSDLSDLVARIKRHPNYTESIGVALGIVAGARNVDVKDVRPELSVSLNGGHPQIDWVKKGLSTTELHVDRGTGTYALLSICSESHYTDRAALPPPGTGAIWNYKAIHRQKDQPVGQWSEVASIGVFG